MVLLKMLSATVSVLGDAAWRPLLLLVYVWTAYAGWNTYGLPGLLVAMALPGISQVICIIYLWQGSAPILEYYDWTMLCAIAAWLASFGGNALWSWIELRPAMAHTRLALQYKLPETPVQAREVVASNMPAVASR
jgi:hypothetical protein